MSSTIFGCCRNSLNSGTTLIARFKIQLAVGYTVNSRMRFLDIQLIRLEILFVKRETFHVI